MNLPSSTLDPSLAARLKRGADGLLAVVVQDADTDRVLMVGWTDDEALARTLRTGSVWFWSRSRSEYWCKGATSGNTLRPVSVELDCDADAVLVRAVPAGPTCHTGATSCFDAGGALPLATAHPREDR